MGGEGWWWGWFRGGLGGGREPWLWFFVFLFWFLKRGMDGGGGKVGEVREGKGRVTTFEGCVGL